MATSPTAQIEILGGEHGGLADTVTAHEVQGDMVIPIPTKDWVAVITREQVMAFFDLRPRPSHDGTDDNCDCGKPTCHNAQ